MLSAFNQHFSAIPDYRQQPKVDHKLHDILLTLIVGVICGVDGWESIEKIKYAPLSTLKQIAVVI